MSMGSQQSPDESHAISSVVNMLQELRTSLNAGNVFPEWLAIELLKVRPPSCSPTVDMLLPETDVEGTSHVAGTQLPNSAGTTLRSLLDNESQLRQLAELVAVPANKQLQELLQREVGIKVTSLGRPDVAGTHEGGTEATQIIGMDSLGSVGHGSRGSSGFDLLSLPTNPESAESSAFKVKQTAEAPIKAVEVENGTLERTFAIRVDEDRNPIVLGRGGMGYVITGSPVSGGAEQAIKVCSDPRHEARMLREFEILSQLTSQGFPLATGKYRDEQGQLCYSMKLVRGDSYLSGFKAFHEVAKAPRSTDKNAIEFIEKYLLVERPADGFHQQDQHQIFTGLLDRLIDVATAVSTMHKKGFIHRDLKPDNVRIELDTRDAVILDFGLAKVQGDADLSADIQEFLLGESMQADLTRMGSVMGTYAYMSPEQASGNSDAHTKATDIYALGAMLYYLMSGRPAVSERDQHGKRRNPMEVLTQIRNGDIEPLFRLPCIRADFADLEAICSKAMAKDPSTRYGSADEMIMDLRAWVSGNPVKAYQEVIRGGAQMRYRFHHWTKQNPGVWNAARTAALGVLTVVGGGGYYSASQSNKANAVASVAEGSLLRINEEVETGLQQFLGSHTIETLPVEQLDRLVSKGEFEAFLKIGRKRLADEILQGGVDRVLRYAQYRVVADIMTQAKQADERLAKIEDVFAQRVANRVRMRQELAEFRDEFAPIRDFLGNDLESFMSDASQQRIDDALARFLQAFRERPRAELAGVNPRLFFPECSEEVKQLVIWCADQELTQSETKDIKDSVALLLSYKVLNLQRDFAGFVPHVHPVLPVAATYLEEARRLETTTPSILDMVLWERVATALRDPRANDLREQVKELEQRVLKNEPDSLEFSNQDLGIIAGDLYRSYRFKDAHALYERILSSSMTSSQSREGEIPSVYLGEVGRARALIGLATEAQPDDAQRYLLEASAAFNRAIGLLSHLSGESSDKREMLGTCYMGLGKVYMSQWYREENSTLDDGIFLPKMREAHSKAKELYPSPRILRSIAADLATIGANDEAIGELTATLELAPHRAGELLSLRAWCFGRLGRHEDMLQDIGQVVSAAKGEEGFFYVAPQNLHSCAAAIGDYVDVAKDSLSPAQKDEYLERMKVLLTDTMESCTSGKPYPPAQLTLAAAAFALLREREPDFCAAYEASILRKEPTTLISLAVLPWRACCNAVIGQEREMLGDVETVLNNARVAHLAWMVGPADLNRCALALAVYLSRKDAQISAEKRAWYLEKMKQLLTEAKQRCSSGFDYTLDQLELDSDYFQVLKDHDPAFWDDYALSVSSSAIHPQARKQRKANTVVEPQAVEGQ